MTEKLYTSPKNSRAESGASGSRAESGASGSRAESGASGSGVGVADVALTQAAAARVRWIAERKGAAEVLLRLAVDGGGCSGFTYRFALAEAVEADDRVSETDGVRLIVDQVSLDFVRGSTVDFVQSLGGASFQVKNPNAASGCGCGSSFSI